MMKNHLCCSALILLTVLGCVGAAAVRCRWGEGCVCLQCPAGQEPSKACGEVGGPSEGAGLSCGPCPPLSFSSGLDAELCRPHAVCDAMLARYALTPGTARSDAVCGPCLPGFQPSDLGTNSTRSPCLKEAPVVRAVRTVGGGASGGPSGGAGAANGTGAVRSAEEKTAEYAVFALVPVFCVMGLLGILICNILKKKGYRCSNDKETGETDSSPQKEGNGCPYIPDDPNEDTISVLVRLITEKKENAAALEELLLEYETKQMNLNKTSSIKFPGLTPLSQFLSLPRLCPHQSHLHTISGLSSLTAPKHGVSGCSRCAQRKWPPVLIPPLDALKDPLKPQAPLVLPSLDPLKPQAPVLALPSLDPLKPQAPVALPSLDPSRSDAERQTESPLLEGVCADALRVPAAAAPRTAAWQVEAPPPPASAAVAVAAVAAVALTTTHGKQEAKDGAPAVLSVGRFQVAQIPEQKAVVVAVETTTKTPSSQNSLFGGKPFRR